MSNRRKIREMNSGRLTRPRSQWTGHARGHSYTPPGMVAANRSSRRLSDLLSALSALKLPGHRGDR